MQTRPKLSPSAELQETAVRVRENIIRMSRQGGCFLGASMSCADLLTFLYGRVLKIDPRRIHAPDRDYLLLSKGHASAGLFAVLAEYGFIHQGRLDNHLRLHDHLYWHPNSSIPGVEFHSGSLGHLLSVGIGIALDIKLRRGPNRVFVVLGDGELNEGSVWEAMLVASAKKLGNLIVIVDRNGLQANARTEDLIPLEPVAAKFESFGWASAEIDGHCFLEMERVLGELTIASGRPTAIVARTVRGKGLPSIENREDRWFVASSEQEAASMIEELYESRLQPAR